MAFTQRGSAAQTRRQGRSQGRPLRMGVKRSGPTNPAARRPSYGRFHVNRQVASAFRRKLDPLWVLQITNRWVLTMLARSRPAPNQRPLIRACSRVAAVSDTNLSPKKVYGRTAGRSTSAPTDHPSWNRAAGGSPWDSLTWNRISLLEISPLSTWSIRVPTTGAGGKTPYSRGHSEESCLGSVKVACCCAVPRPRGQIPGSDSSPTRRTRDVSMSRTYIRRTRNRFARCLRLQRSAPVSIVP